MIVLLVWVLGWVGVWVVSCVVGLRGCGFVSFLVVVWLFGVGGGVCVGGVWFLFVCNCCVAVVFLMVGWFVVCW